MNILIHLLQNTFTRTPSLFQVEVPVLHLLSLTLMKLRLVSHCMLYVGMVNDIRETNCSTKEHSSLRFSVYSAFIITKL